MAAILCAGMGFPGLLHAEPVGAFAAPDNAPLQTPLNQGADTFTVSGNQSDSTDKNMTERIHQAIVWDRSLSLDAHNVKVVVKDRKVVLIGRVDSENEKLIVESKAVQVAGSANVSAQLDVKMNQEQDKSIRKETAL